MDGGGAGQQGSAGSKSAVASTVASQAVPAVAPFSIKAQLAQMLKGGVIMGTKG